MLRLAPHVGHKTHLIWDWNGTLLDDVEICVATMQELLLEHELPSIDKKRYEEIFRFPVREYYVDLGFDFANKHSFEGVSEKFISGYGRRMEQCALHRGARDLLKLLHESGKKQAILSAAKESALLEQLEKFEVREFFDQVYGLSDIYAAGKLERGRELLAAWNADPKHIILIGDTEHDLEVAHALSIDVVLVDSGHQSMERLVRRHPKTVSRK